MLRLFFYLIISLNFLFAIDIRPLKTPLYKEIDLSYNINSIEEAIRSEDKFVNIKRFRRLFHRHAYHSNTWLKIPLENNSGVDLKRVFVTRWDRVYIKLYAVDDGKIVFQDIIQSDDYLKKSLPITIPKNKKIDLFVSVKTGKSLEQFSYIYFVSDEVVDDFIILRNKLYNHGFFFGILFSMTLYSFFMYFSIKERGYLYLGFYQAWVLLVISDLWQYLYVFLNDSPIFAYLFLKSMFDYNMIFFSILFTKEFLNTKKRLPRLNTILNLYMILLLPISLAVTKINYGSFFYVIYVFAGLYVFYKRRSLAALFFTIGFLGFAVFSVALNLSRVFDWDFYFELTYAKQIFTCIESFALTMALFLKLRLIVKEKEEAKMEIIKKEKLMLEQSRFATMGEMIASIAHQWRQPLNHITMIFANLQLANETNKLDTKYLNKKTKEANLQLKYMSDTIEDFSSFFSKRGEVKEFTLEQVCKLSLDLVSSRCKKYEIKIFEKDNVSKLHKNYKNELTQVLVVILNNAIDALMLNNIENRKINIEIESNTITINDNAGGIPENIIHKILDPYFSTKDKKFGTGLGLYTAKTIVETLMKGKITVKNLDDGASFSISIP